MTPAAEIISAVFVILVGISLLVVSWKLATIKQSRINEILMSHNSRAERERLWNEIYRVERERRWKKVLK